MYCTLDEVRTSIKDDSIDGIIGNSFIEDKSEKEILLSQLIIEAIEDADGEIDGYLNKRYPTPLSNVPKVINKFSKDIALYNLMSRAGIIEDSREGTYLERYKAAIRFLENVAKGLIDIGIRTATEEVSRPASDFRINSSNRIFSRDSLSGM
jgi:phage gp36-like protein